MAPEVDAYGWLPLSRLFFDSPFWTAPRELSEAEAWLDILQTAAYRPYRKVIGSVVVDLGERQVLGAVPFFELRWKWSEKRVRIFLETLQKLRWITAGARTPKGRIYTVDSEWFAPQKGRQEGGNRGAIPAQGRHKDGTRRARQGRHKKEGNKGTREFMKSTATSARETSPLERARQEQMDLIAGALDIEDLTADEAEDLGRRVREAATIDALDEVTRLRYAIVEARRDATDKELFERYHRDPADPRGAR